MNKQIVLISVCFICCLIEANAIDNWPFTTNIWKHAPRFPKTNQKSNVEHEKPHPTYESIINFNRKNKIDPARVEELQRNARIFNGKESYASHFRYMVSLKWPYEGEHFGRHYCGGTLIAKDVVLTAGHCILYDEIEVTVKGNRRHLDGSERFKTIGSGVIHPYYLMTGGDFDIGILYLNGQSSMNPVKLSNKVYRQDTSSKTVVTGWGLMENGEYPDHLMQVSVDLMSNKECNDESDYEFFITDSMLCAGRPELGKDSCYGDSGGPLLIYEGGHMKQIGIVSFGGEICADVRAPGVYSRISHSYDWIMDKMEAIVTPAPTPDSSENYPTYAPTEFDGNYTSPPTPETDYTTEYHRGTHYLHGFKADTYVKVTVYEDSECTAPFGSWDGSDFNFIMKNNVCFLEAALQKEGDYVTDFYGHSTLASCEDDGFCTIVSTPGTTCDEDTADVIEAEVGECVSSIFISGEYMKLSVETKIPKGMALFVFGFQNESMTTEIMSHMLSTEECMNIEGKFYTTECENGAGTLFEHEDSDCQLEGVPVLQSIQSDETLDAEQLIIDCVNGA